MSPSRLCLLFVLLWVVDTRATRHSLLLKEMLSEAAKEREIQDLYDEQYDSKIEVDDLLITDTSDEPAATQTTDDATDFPVKSTIDDATDLPVKSTIDDSTEPSIMPTNEGSTHISANPTTMDSTDESSVLQTESSAGLTSEATHSTTSTTTSTSTTTKTTSKLPLTTSTTPAPVSSTPTASVRPPPTDYRRVHVEGLGTARGRILRSFLGREFYGFMSIPYALPPEGKRRFRYPEPWEGEWPKEVDGDYDSTWLRARCPQISLILDVIAGREDCLHLSIYTPMLPEDMDGGDGLPVMFWIHGGAYMTGDANLYVPTKLMDRKVVVVVVQYRLGTLGFLAGGIPDAPGNMGLMDQIMGLRWVQDYIENFGGNPNLVTVFGQSAGGASASWMQVTPLTNESAPANKGRQLVHRVIPQSGSALELWTIDDSPAEAFNLTASVLKCWGEEVTTEEMLSCMRDKPFQEVERAALALYANDRREGGLGFKGLCPVIQSDLIDTDIEVVIREDPRASLEKGEFLRVPVMTGSVRDEGSLVVGLTYRDYMYPNNHSIEDEDFMRDQALHKLINAFGIDDKNGAVTDSMRLAYLPNAVLGQWDTMVGGMIDMCGVLFLKSGLWEMTHYINKAAPYNPVFFYSWEYLADDSLFRWMFLSMPHIPVPGGICHADELLYLFHLPGDMDERQKVMVQRMVKIWTNFAKYGHPTPYEVEYPEEAWQEDMPMWRPFSIKDPNFMLIADNFTLDQDFMTRWNYHRDNGQTTSTPPAMTTEPDISQEEYHELLHQKQSFQASTGALGGVCACLVFIVIFLIVRLRRKRGFKE